MYPSYRPQRQPNYTARRAIALTGVVLVLYFLIRVLGSLFGGGSDEDVAARDTVQTTTSTTIAQLVPPPACAVGTEASIYAQPTDWFRSIVDSTYGLPSTYEIPDLVSSGEANYADDFEIRELMVEDLNGMRNAILEAGIPEVALQSAYRSHSAQQNLAESASASESDTPGIATDVTAAPGHSEHQLGTAIDVRPIGARSVDESFGETETGLWLAEHSWEYGFILTHPEGSEDLTCFVYSPNHFRYVGIELAKRVHDSNLTLREYLWHWEATGKEPDASMSRAPRTTTTAPGSETDTTDTTAATDGTDESTTTTEAGE